MVQNSIITVDYRLTFKEMLKRCGISRHQVTQIEKQLGDLTKINFPHKGLVRFEVHDFNFGQPTTVRGAEQYIRHHNPESKWEPFDAEHLIHYYQLDQNQKIFTNGLVYASKRTFLVNGVNHVFVLENRNGYPDLELIPDNRPRAAYMSNFPGQRKIVKQK